MSDPDPPPRRARPAPRRVAVTGVGVVSPLGLAASTFWANLTDGRCGIRKNPRFDTSGFVTDWSAVVPDYKITDHVPKAYRKSSKVMSRDIELAVLAARDAFATSGLRTLADEGGPDFDPAEFGCNVAAGLISADLDELAPALHAARDAADRSRVDWRTWGETGMQQLTPLWMLKYLPNMLACHVTIIHGLTGPSNNITCAEAGGHLSVGEAFRTIQRGHATFAIAGGVESLVNPMAMMRQQLLGRLAGRDAGDDPAEVVRPFDPEARGTVVGEGGALLILEDYGHARERGATIYAEVAGFAARQDVYDPVLPDPAGSALASATRAALRDADVLPGEVDLIVPHGLGIATCDASELAGLRAVFGDRLASVPAAPTKAQLGNSAAGTAVDAAVAVLALHHGVVPPAANTPRDVLNVCADARDLSPAVAVAGIYGLGGHNAAIVFRSAPD